jgi:hypothetical protein
LADIIDRVTTEQLRHVAGKMAEARRNLSDHLDDPSVSAEQREIMHNEINRIGDERGKILDELARREAAAA